MLPFSPPQEALTPVSLSLSAGRPPEVSFLVLPCSGKATGVWDLWDLGGNKLVAGVDLQEGYGFQGLQR